jgi:integrase
MWWFALYTGMRVSELARLRWSDIDCERRLIYIYRQKSGKQGTIPLNKKAEEALSLVAPGKPDEFVFHSPLYPASERNTDCFCGYVTALFRRYRRAAGITRRLTTHSLRHGHCTLLAQRGKPAYVIMASARHASVRTSMVYVHLQNEHLRTELDDAFGDQLS